jgi:3-methyladenine DNA glycosylase Mpg
MSAIPARTAGTPPDPPAVPERPRCVCIDMKTAVNEGEEVKLHWANADQYYIDKQYRRNPYSRSFRIGVVKALAERIGRYVFSPRSCRGMACAL